MLVVFEGLKVWKYGSRFISYFLMSCTPSKHFSVFSLLVIIVSFLSLFQLGIVWDSFGIVWEGWSFFGIVVGRVEGLYCAYKGNTADLGGLGGLKGKK